MLPSARTTHFGLHAMPLQSGPFRLDGHTIRSGSMPTMARIPVMLMSGTVIWAVFNGRYIHSHKYLLVHIMFVSVALLAAKRKDFFPRRSTCITCKVMGHSNNHPLCYFLRMYFIIYSLLLVNVLVNDNFWRLASLQPKVKSNGRAMLNCSWTRNWSLERKN